MEDISLFIHQLSKRGVTFHFVPGAVLGAQNTRYQCLAQDIGSKVNDYNSCGKCCNGGLGGKDETLNLVCKESGN